MPSRLSLMCVLAHPDDESLGTGGILARYAAEGVSTSLITATTGQRGRYGLSDVHPGIEEVGRVRAAELRAAAAVLKVGHLRILDYMDSELDRAEVTRIVPEIAAFIRERRPQVVVTFDPFGAYGHPDHIAISQFTGAAIVAAADPNYPCDGPVHGVSKLYYFVSAKPAWDAYQAAFKQLTIKVDEVVRQASPWPDWSITTSVNTEAHWRIVWEAIRCHRTQLTIYEKLMTLPEEYHVSLWGRQEFYRAFSIINGGRQREDDLFAGLR